MIFCSSGILPLSLTSLTGPFLLTLSPISYVRLERVCVLEPENSRFKTWSYLYPESSLNFESYIVTKKMRLLIY